MKLKIKSQSFIYSTQIWDISQCEPSSEISKPMERINCLDEESYIRSCKVINEGKSLLIGGESSLISLWDLNCGGSPKLKVCFVHFYFNGNEI